MLTNPKVQNASGIFPEYLIIPDIPDFKNTKNEEAPKDNVDA